MEAAPSRLRLRVPGRVRPFWHHSRDRNEELGMSLREALAGDGVVFTGEVGPPKGIDTHEVWEEAEDFRERCVAINVTDNQSSVMRISCLAVCIKLKQMGIEPILQMVCRDRNRLSLQSELLGSAIWGIENVLALTGDHIALGDHKSAKPVHDLDSVSLLRTISALMQGKDVAGNRLDGAWKRIKLPPPEGKKRPRIKYEGPIPEKCPTFFPGAVVTPCADPMEPQIIKMEKKVEAGARFIQTQAVYDAAQLETFIEAAKHIDVPVLAGLVMLKNAKMAEFMNQYVAGVSVPDSLIQEMADAPRGDEKKISTEIAARLMREMSGMCKGFHLMPLGWSKEAVAAIEASGLA
jgi:5,10-methylenetetrahydrofolate reductase